MSQLLTIAEAYRLCRASQAAYHDSATFAQEFGLSVETFGGGQIAGLLAWNAVDLLVAFRGTVLAERDSDPARWGAMFGAMFCNISFAQVEACGGRVHRGFWTALEGVWPRVSERVDALSQAGRRLLIAGHSQGGALATLAGWRWHDAKEKVAAVCTFGCPRVGNADFANHFPVPLERFENQNDLVPHLPPPPALAQQLQGVLGEWIKNNVDYQHAGRLRYLTSNGELHDEPGRLELIMRVGRLVVESVRRPTQLLRDHSVTAYADALNNLLKR